jgi:hypothetical protein
MQVGLLKEERSPRSLPVFCQNRNPIAGKLVEGQQEDSVNNQYIIFLAHSLRVPQQRDEG